MEKEFLSVNPDSGGSGETAVNVTVPKNAGVARNASLNFAGGGATKLFLFSNWKRL